MDQYKIVFKWLRIGIANNFVNSRLKKTSISFNSVKLQLMVFFVEQLYELSSLMNLLLYSKNILNTLK